MTDTTQSFYTFCNAFCNVCTVEPQIRVFELQTNTVPYQRQFAYLPLALSPGSLLPLPGEPGNEANLPYNYTNKLLVFLFGGGDC